MQKVERTEASDIDFLTPPGRERIALSRLGGTQPGVIFFGGLRSDMTGSKALRVEDVCRREGRACTRFDYSGHGRSGGRFEDGTIGSWLADARTVVDDAGDGPHIFVGSSLGGWIALLLAMEIPNRVAAIVGISAAADFTAHVYDTLFSDAHRAEMDREGRVLVPDCHGGPPFEITRRLIEEGRNHLLLGRDAIPVSCPVRLIHARNDDDVPWDTGLKLAERLESADVHVTVVKDGDHQLARECDLKLLDSTLGSVFSE